MNKIEVDDRHGQDRHGQNGRYRQNECRKCNGIKQRRVHEQASALIKILRSFDLDTSMKMKDCNVQTRERCHDNQKGCHDNQKGITVAKRVSR